MLGISGSAGEIVDFGTAVVAGTGTAADCGSDIVAVVDFDSDTAAADFGIAAAAGIDFFVAGDSVTVPDCC